MLLDAFVIVIGSLAEVYPLGRMTPPGPYPTMEYCTVIGVASDWDDPFEFSVRRIPGSAGSTIATFTAGLKLYFQAVAPAIGLLSNTTLVAVSPTRNAHG